MTPRASHSWHARDGADDRQNGAGWSVNVSLPRRRSILGPLEHTERLLVHFVDDLGVGAGARLETGPGHGVGRVAIGVEVVEDLAGRYAGSEAVQPSEIARRRTWIWFGEQRHAEFLERGYRNPCQLGPRR